MRIQSPLPPLLRWLGPWTPDAQAPPGIRAERWLLRPGRVPGLRGYLQGDALPRPGAWRGSEQPAQLEVVRYDPPGEPLGHYIVVQGLHYQGADDPRMDRFCRVLANAGFQVHVPMLPTYLDLLLSPSVATDLETAVVRICESLPRGTKPTLFSISFGSAPALEVAARMPDALDAVITFGGYAELNAALGFCLDGVMHTPAGAVTLERDPLNAPVLFLNLVPFLDLGDTERFERALREAAYRTWGRPELKRPGARDVAMYELAERVPRSQRQLFLLATGLLPSLDGLSARQWLDLGLERGHDELHFARPEAAIKRAILPAVILHGREDDVIPWGEALKLEQALSPRVRTRLFVTGLFAHTGSEPPSIQTAGKEAGALFGMLSALSRAGRVRGWV